MTRSTRSSRSQRNRDDDSKGCLWVLGFDDHARDRYNDPPSPLSRAYLADSAAERDSEQLDRSIGGGFAIVAILILALPLGLSLCAVCASSI